ncbi:MAG: IS200/IS605 family transposase [Candidatus Hydrogenedentes bacterium]|nr:IS200/IS605 family transposase [Candidatus Hydrogenedentota bacterium]
MPQSLSNVMVHVVFSTKNRLPVITPEVQPKLYGYMFGILSGINCHAIRIGGTLDHVHALCVLGRAVSVADLIEELKRQSSKWMKLQGESFRDFFWQRGYGAFSVSESNGPAVQRYINSQMAHHRKMDFQEEFRALLRRHRIEFDERYIWD